MCRFFTSSFKLENPYSAEVFRGLDPKSSQMLTIPPQSTCECVHLVTRVYFRSRDNDGGYTIRSAVPEKPMLHANITALCLIERELLPIEVLHCENRNSGPFQLL